MCQPASQGAAPATDSVGRVESARPDSDRARTRARARPDLRPARPGDDPGSDNLNAVPVMALPWPARVRVTGTVGPQAAAGPGATESGSPALSPVRVLRWLSVAGGPGAGWSRARGPDRAVSELAARPASRAAAVPTVVP